MYDKNDKRNRGDDKSINRVFGEYIDRLRKEAHPKLSQVALAEKTGLTKNEINRIIHGELRATPDKISRLARTFVIDEEILRVIAGKPSLAFIRSFQKSPTEFTHKIMGNTQPYKIGIAEVLLGAHVFWVPNTHLPVESVCKFEVKTYETGREAFRELVADEVQFATVTEAVLKYGKVRAEDYVKVLFFTVPQHGDFYSVYGVESRMTKHDLTLAYLQGTASERASTVLRSPRHHITKVPKESVKEIAEALGDSEIDGFFGWSPLHYKVNHELRGISKKTGTVVKSPELNLPSSFDQRLYLVAKEEYLQKHPLVLRELIQTIILAREELNHILEENNQVERKRIKQVLVKHMSYLKDFDIDNELSNLRFDSNIKSDAFKYLFKA